MEERAESHHINMYDFFRDSSPTCSRSEDENAAEASSSSMSLDLDLSLSLGPTVRKQSSEKILSSNKQAGEAQFPAKDVLKHIAGHEGARNKLTLFYNGSASTYENISEDTAKAVMHLAQAAASKTEVASPVATPSVSCTPTATPSVCCTPTVSCTTPISRTSVAQSERLDEEPTGTTIDPQPQGGMNLARRASFARFLVKRKQRIREQGPYAKGMNNEEEANAKEGHKDLECTSRSRGRANQSAIVDLTGTRMVVDLTEDSE